MYVSPVGIVPRPRPVVEVIVVELVVHLNPSRIVPVAEPRKETERGGYGTYGSGGGVAIGEYCKLRAVDKLRGQEKAETRGCGDNATPL